MSIWRNYFNFFFFFRLRFEFELEEPKEKQQNIVKKINILTICEKHACICQLTDDLSIIELNGFFFSSLRPCSRRENYIKIFQWWTVYSLVSFWSEFKEFLWFRSYHNNEKTQRFPCSNFENHICITYEFHNWTFSSLRQQFDKKNALHRNRKKKN